MYYYKMEKDANNEEYINKYKIIIDKEELNKYKIIIDKEELNKLRWEVIDNCSNIIHKSYRTTETPIYDKEHFRNYKEKKDGVFEYIDAPDEDAYLVEYDYLEHSILIKYIDNLLNDNYEIINKIKKYNKSFKDNSKDLKKEAEDLANEISLITINNLDINLEEYINKLNILNKNIHEQEILKKKYKTENLYKNKILSCISYKFVNSYKVSSLRNKIDKINKLKSELNIELKQLKKFFIDTNDYNLDNKTKKLIKNNLD